MKCDCSCSTYSTNNEQFFVFSFFLSWEGRHLQWCWIFKLKMSQFESSWIYDHMNWNYIRNKKGTIVLSLIKMYLIYCKHDGWILVLKVKCHSNEMSSRFSESQQELRPFWCSSMTTPDFWINLSDGDWPHDNGEHLVPNSAVHVFQMWIRDPVLCHAERNNLYHIIWKAISFLKKKISDFGPVCFHFTSDHTCVFHVVSVWFCSKTSQK